MTLQKIDFAHFYLETVTTIEKEFANLINPNSMMFYKCGNIYLALTQSDKNIVVNFAINTGKRNTGDWVADLIKEAIKSNFEHIIFVTSEKNTIVQKIADKWKCKLVKKEPNYYSDGSAAYIYESLVLNLYNFEI